MNTAEPKIIYLQIGEDADITEFEEGDFWTNAITWCWERIFDNDIEYISKSNLFSLIDEMLSATGSQEFRNGSREIDGYVNGYQKALTEIKKKIMEKK